MTRARAQRLVQILLGALLCVTAVIGATTSATAAAPAPVPAGQTAGIDQTPVVPDPGAPAGTGDLGSPDGWRDADEGQPDQNSFLDQLVGPLPPIEGMYSLSHYDIGYSTAGFMGSKNPTVVVPGWLTDTMYGLGVLAVALGIWLFVWVLDFGVAGLLLEPAANIAEIFENQIIEPLGLTAFFMFLAAAFAAWLWIGKSHGARALGEVLTSLVAATLLGLILTNPAQVILGDDGLLGRTRDVSLIIAGAALDGSPEARAGAGAGMAGPDADDPGGGGGGIPPASGELVAPLTAGLQRTFVALPHQLLSWGRSVDVAGDACQAAYHASLAGGPWGTADEPRETMKDAGCEAEAEFNASPTNWRLAGAASVGIASWLVFVLLVVMALGLIGAQIELAWAVIQTPFALLSAVLPGKRSWLGSWAAGMFAALATVVALVTFIVVFLLLVQGLLGSDDGLPLIARMLLLDLLAITAPFMWKRVAGAARATGGRAGAKLASLRPGSSAAPTAPASSRPNFGPALAQAWGQVRTTQARRGSTSARPPTNPGGGAATGARTGRTITVERREPGTGAGTGTGVGTAHRYAAGQSRPVRIAHSTPAPPPAKPTPTTRTGRVIHGTGRVAASTAKAALASTIGAPVAIPRAAAKVRAATSSATAHVTGRVNERAERARSYRQEYAHNVHAAAAKTGQVATRAGQVASRFARGRDRWEG